MGDLSDLFLKDHPIDVKSCFLQVLECVKFMHSDSLPISISNPDLSIENILVSGLKSLLPLSLFESLH